MARPSLIRANFAIGELERARREFSGAKRRFDALARQANAALAAQLQTETVAALRSGLVRKQAATGTLARVTASPGNRYSSVSGFGVGVVRHLNASPAGPYWRIIEGLAGQEVYTGHVGRQLTGYWGGPQPFNPAGGRARFHPRGRQAAYQLLRAAGFSPKQASQTRGVIRRGIAAEHYYRRAWLGFNSGQRWQRTYEQLLAQAGLPARIRRVS